MEVTEKEIIIYHLNNGRVPYLEWFSALKEDRVKQVIQARIARVRLGNFGNIRSVGERVTELKINFGPGYRIYFSQDGDKVVVILCGGDKSSQNEDIKKAKAYWKNYKERKENE